MRWSTKQTHTYHFERATRLCGSYQIGCSPGATIGLRSDVAHSCIIVSYSCSAWNDNCGIILLFPMLAGWLTNWLGALVSVCVRCVFSAILRIEKVLFFWSATSSVFRHRCFCETPNRSERQLIEQILVPSLRADFACLLSSRPPRPAAVYLIGSVRGAAGSCSHGLSLIAMQFGWRRHRRLSHTQRKLYGWKFSTRLLPRQFTCCHRVPLCQWSSVHSLLKITHTHSAQTHLYKWINNQLRVLIFIINCSFSKGQKLSVCWRVSMQSRKCRRAMERKRERERHWAKANARQIIQFFFSFIFRMAECRYFLVIFFLSSAFRSLIYAESALCATQDIHATNAPNIHGIKIEMSGLLRVRIIPIF